jgi:hypothetical protein
MTFRSDGVGTTLLLITTGGGECGAYDDLWN